MRLLYCAVVVAFACVFRRTDGHYVHCVSIQCNSWQYKLAVCRAEQYINSIHLVARHSVSTCDIEQSYGFFGQYVWVDHGCRATFKICA
ncbi:lectin ADEL-like [Mercenaria mercenaria]|uniref:lectin ADEL-like n=1 Tax=Mercenaria mercenaria TaxID=6596 RepID=UPI001E1DE19F|nr:lectin ADEL-like [Mercenaria mercenaria]XP_045179018.1 lectin ADEL-like [Mercenaria mercenaria]